jgi:lambda repressor-like predicted transcriptional regulator
MAKIDLRKIILSEMKKRKISIPAMSRTIGCNQQTLYDFFAGRKALTANYLQAVLNELGAAIKF